MDPLASAPAIVRQQVMGQEIRRFADSGLNESITKALNSLEPGAQGAVLFHGGKEGITATTVANLGAHIGGDWSIVTAIRRPWDGEFEGEAAVRFQWPPKKR